MLKLEDNPAQLLPTLARPADAKGEWWVAHTKPRTEKALAWDLTAKGVPYYLPLARRTIVSGGRRRTAMHPLFPSYIFFCGDDVARLAVLTTKRVVNTLPVRQRDAFVSELEAVHSALSVNGDLTIYPHVAVGKRCRVARGPMRGVEGVVVKDNDVLRIVLQVSIIGQGASLEISAADLEDAN
ncbi:MAG: transcription antiterminator [Phycisphaerales bacterium]|nr:transcription antiterminator [Phycisphaerales bacterium]